MGSLGQGTWILILSSVFDMSCAAVLSQSVVSDTFVTPWTVACQAPLSMGFSRHEYWSGHSPLQEIFLTQRSNLGLLHCKQILYQLSH